MLWVLEDCKASHVLCCTKKIQEKKEKVLTAAQKQFLSQLPRVSYRNVALDINHETEME